MRRGREKLRSNLFVTESLPQQNIKAPPIFLPDILSLRATFLCCMFTYMKKIAIYGVIAA